MTTVLCRCRVADYDAWRPGYDHALQVTPGVRTYRIWRGQDDANLIVIEETFDSREHAQAVSTCQPCRSSTSTRSALEHPEFGVASRHGPQSQTSWLSGDRDPAPESRPLRSLI
jgi:hypothetical protein